MEDRGLRRVAATDTSEVSAAASSTALCGGREGGCIARPRACASGCTGKSRDVSASLMTALRGGRKEAISGRVCVCAKGDASKSQRGVAAPVSATLADVAIRRGQVGTPAGEECGLLHITAVSTCTSAAEAANVGAFIGRAGAQSSAGRLESPRGAIQGIRKRRRRGRRGGVAARLARAEKPIRIERREWRRQLQQATRACSSS